ncbi:tripartite tricarboxylate transporter substrate binding protein [Fodinicurvata fenggangensis]|uniref:tripartite tricarboxylate transporter substrate binding protein n=1 Tax=Fodinicurvata fenggangensis TaxID=1121830 RepID=UPI0012DBFBCC|nr:tripartite tricarboxylate transporter substrate binding protein [Fodinicurvata fenggangensis]
MSLRKTSLTLACTLAAGLALGGAAAAQDFPDGPVEMIVPWGPGGGSDTLMRIVANHGEEYLGESIPVINLPGVSGTQGLEEARERDADGYTMAQIHEGLLVSHYTGVTDVHPDDFEPVASFTLSPQYVVVNADTPWQTFDEFVEYAKENPGEVTFGVTMAGVPHLHAAMIEDATGAEFSYVGYEGTGERIQALVGGHIDAAIGDIASSLEFVKNDDLRFLATGATERIEATPDVPTLQELGHDLELTINRGLFVPKGTPEERIEVLEESLTKLENDEEFIEQVNAAGAEVVIRSRDDYAEYMDNLDQTVSNLAEHIKQ